jgi:hypothetical protein
MVGGVMGEIAEVKKVATRDVSGTADLQVTVAAQQRAIHALTENVRQLQAEHSAEARKHKSEIHALEHTMTGEIKRLKAALRRAEQAPQNTGGGATAGAGAGGSASATELADMRRTITAEFTQGFRKMGRDIVVLGDRLLKVVSGLEDNVKASQKGVRSLGSEVDREVMVSVWC